MQDIMKKSLIAACIKHQEATAQTAKLLMNEAQQMANDYGAPKDRYDSFRTKQERMAAMYSNQFDNAQESLRTLLLIDPDKKSDCVEFGSYVTTDKQKMLISVSIGQMTAEGETFYAISVKVPVYAVMKGKKVGDTFTFNGVTQKILNII